MNTSQPIQWMCPMLNVFDMSASLHFYCDIIGFTIKESAGPGDDTGWVLLELGNIYLMLNTLYEKPDRPAAPDPTRTNHHGDTALYFSHPGIDLVYHHLKENGITVTPPYLTGYGFKAIDLKDPDGFTIVFHWVANEAR